MSLLSPIIKLAKSGLPDRDILLPVIAGPFRGARFFSNPQVAMRKVFGAYEHELTGWLERALPRIDVIVDVGANDGYFTFGCAKALQRSGKEIRVIAIEASESHVKRLEEARAQTVSPRSRSRSCTRSPATPTMPRTVRLTASQRRCLRTSACS
jgi:hypothetical protein